MSEQADIRARLDDMRSRANYFIGGPSCAWCDSATLGIAKHNDGTWHPSCGHDGHGFDWGVVDAPSQGEVMLNDVPRAYAALTEVLKLHRPVDIEPSETICHGCSTLRGSGENARYFPFEEYPCPTVARIIDALA